MPQVFFLWVTYFLLDVHTSILLIIIIFYIKMKMAFKPQAKHDSPQSVPVFLSLLKSSGFLFCGFVFFLVVFAAWLQLLPSVFASAVCRLGRAIGLSETSQSIHSHIV